MKIVSGGQTGVDRAALDAAEAAGLERGGWCPRGRWAEDGRIPLRYPLDEAPERDPAQRSEWNVRDSDATLVLCRGTPGGGTALTIACARRLGRPLRVVDLAEGAVPEALAAWIRARGVATLNVAGPRESQAPGIGAESRSLLEAVFSALSPRPAGKRRPGAAR